MTITELIAQLEGTRKQYGDLEVMLHVGDDGSGLNCVEVDDDGDGRWVSLSWERWVEEMERELRQTTTEAQ